MRNTPANRVVRVLRAVMISCFALIGTQLASPCAYGVNLTRNQQLILACYKVDVAKVARCLRDGANVDATMGPYAGEDLFQDSWSGGLPMDTQYWTPLMAVCNAPEYPDPPPGHERLWENDNLVKRLQADIGQEVLTKRRAGEVAIVLMLLSHKADINRTDRHCSTALAMAVTNDKVYVVRQLLEFGANPNTKERVYIDGPSNLTPLHLARSKVVFQLLLDHGANPAAKDSWGHLPEGPPW